MAVSSLKVYWSKLAARVRDYIDVDSFYRPNVENEDIPDGVLTRFANTNTIGGDMRTARGLILHGAHEIHKSSGRKRSLATKYEKPSHHGNIIDSAGDSRSGKSPATSHNPNDHHSHSQFAKDHSHSRHHHRHHHHHHHHKQQQLTHESPSLFRTPEHRSTHRSSNVANNNQNCQHTDSGSRLSQLGYTKRKTNLGQIYFVDSNGRRDWHDPTVPKELLNANLDLDTLIGPLSSNWEVRQTSSGRTYYTNHLKLTTQLTDPRLVAYKDGLMSYLRQMSNNTHTYETIASDSQRPLGTTTTSPVAIAPPPPPSSRSQAGDKPTPTNSRKHSHRSPSVLSPLSQAPASNQRFNSGRSNALSASSTALSCAVSCQQQNSQNGIKLNKRSLATMQESASTPARDQSAGTARQSTQNLDLTNNSRQDITTDNIYSGTLGPDWDRRYHFVTNALFRGSHQNLTLPSGAAGNSNTLTGPPPSWFKQPIALNALREELQCHNNNDNNLETNRRSSCNQAINVDQNGGTSELTNRTSVDDHHRNRYLNADYSLDTTAVFDQDLNEKEQLKKIRTKELTDKISILRQELLKQQDLAHPCKISIHRKRIFEESFRTVSQMSPKDLKKRLLIKFRGEEGLDYGGVAREWFYLLSKEILNPAHGLFQYTSDDIYNLQINPDSGIVYREHLSYLNFCGRIIGMAVFHGHFIEGRFTLPFYKMLLNKPITLSDIEYVDPELHRSLCWILDNDITDIIDTTFLVQHNSFGQLREHELKEHGRNISVTNDNKWEYVSLYVNYRCRRGIEHQFAALQRGFHEIVSPMLVENFDEHELELLIGGLSKINVDDWRTHTKLKNCTTETPLVVWFWDIVQSYDEDKRARLLQFVTGSPRVPIQGFKALQGVNSEQRLFTIHMIRNGNTDNLPKSHTCFNRIDLPPYETYDKLRDKLTQAIEETMGFAMQ